MFYSTYVLVGGVHNNKKKLGCFTNIFYIYYRFFSSQVLQAASGHTRTRHPALTDLATTTAARTPWPTRRNIPLNISTKNEMETERRPFTQSVFYCSLVMRFLLRFDLAFSVAIWLYVFCDDLIMRFLLRFDFAFSVAFWFCIFCCDLIMRFLLRFYQPFLH